MIYRGTGFFSRGRMIRLQARPSSRQQLVVSLSQSSCVSPVELTEGGGGKTYDREKAWPSINHLILSALYVHFYCAAHTIP
jgi:hypothetical protein